MEELDILKHIYQGDNFYIYQVDNREETKFYYQDEMREELLEIDEVISFDDGGTVIYTFTNNSELEIYHKNEYNDRYEDYITYNNNKLKEKNIYLDIII